MVKKINRKKNFFIDTLPVQTNSGRANRISVWRVYTIYINLCCVCVDLYQAENAAELGRPATKVIQFIVCKKEFVGSALPCMTFTNIKMQKIYGRKQFGTR